MSEPLGAVTTTSAALTRAADLLGLAASAGSRGRHFTAGDSTLALCRKLYFTGWYGIWAVEKLACVSVAVCMPCGAAAAVSQPYPQAPVHRWE